MRTNIRAVQLTDHFTYGKLLRFTLPSIIMMIFTSVYSVVDGLFVSNFVGKTSFAAVNLIFPFLMFLGVLGFMLGTGGSALVGKTLGENNPEKANKIFSLLVLVGFVAGCALSLITFPFIDNVAKMLGAEGELLGHCTLYGRLLLISLPFFILQNIFQPFMVVADRPDLGLYITLLAGILNILFDFIFIVVLDLGLVGAAFATVIAETIGGLLPIFYFLFPNKSRLKFVRPEFDSKALIASLTNGSSEFFANISGTIVAMCYNFQLMRYLGEDGVAAFGVIMYVQFIFFAIFLGFSIGSSPIISFNFGAKRHAELRNVLLKSLYIIAVASLIITFILELSSYTLTKLFVGYNTDLHQLTLRAFRIYGLSYLLVGFNFFASSFFTALNNGFISALISTVRALVFELAAVFAIPAIFGVDGIWFSVIFAETASLILSATLINIFKYRYNYDRRAAIAT